MKANEAPPLPDTTQQLAQRIFAELYEMILNQEAGVRRGEVESIHDMRVATRRLRVALINFAACWPKQERRQMKTWLQTLADALGEVRDLDVLQEALRQKQNSLSAAERLLLHNLLERLRRQRQRRFHALLVFLNGDTYEVFKRDFPSMFTVQTMAAAA